MSQGAAGILDGEKRSSQESKVEIRIEHVPVQEVPDASPEQKPAAEASTIDASGRSMSTLINHLVFRMQEVGEQYANSVQAATKQLLDRVDSATKASYAAKAIPMTSHNISTARDEFEGKVLEAAGLLDTQRQMIIEEVQTLDRQGTGNHQEKITQTEASVAFEEIRIQQMIEDVTLDIPVLMRANAAQKEMKAYLEGLKFCGIEAPPQR